MGRLSYRTRTHCRTLRAHPNITTTLGSIHIDSNILPHGAHKGGRREEGGGRREEGGGRREEGGGKREEGGGRREEGGGRREEGGLEDIHIDSNILAHGAHKLSDLCDKDTQV